MRRLVLAGSVLLLASLASPAREATAMERMITSGDAKIATQSIGDRGNPTLLLVMGATASMLWWPQDFCDKLAAAGFHVIRYDHRDTGRSTSYPPGEPAYAVEDLADDMIAVLDAYGVDKAHVIGMSLGGYVAQMAAVRRANRIASLVLIGSEPLGWTGPPLPGIAPRFMAHFESFGALDTRDRAAMRDFLLEGARLSAGDACPFDAERELRRIDAELERAGDIRSAFNHGMLTVREDWSDATARISQPVLVLHGEQDPILPLPNGEAIAAAIPGARLIVLKGVGHEIPPVAIPLMIGAITGFMRRDPSPASPPPSRAARQVPGKAPDPIR